MKVEEIIEDLRFAVRDLKEQDIQTVPIERFEAYIAAIEKEAERTPHDIRREVYALEDFRSRREDWVSKRDIRRRRGEEMVTHTISTGAQALKAVLGINGGAAIALLAFFGSFAKAPNTLAIPAGLADSLAAFVGGVLAAALAFGITFFSQAGFGGEFGKRSAAIGKWGRRAAILMVAISLGAFTTGGWMAAQAVASQAALSGSAPATITPRLQAPKP